MKAEAPLSLTTAVLESIPPGLAALFATVAPRAARAAGTCEACGSREQLLTSVLERVPDVVLLLDADGRLRYTNAAGRATWCLGAGDAVLESPAIHPDDVASVRSSWGRLLGMPGKTVSAEVRIQRAHGWTRATVTAENLLGDPGIAGVLITATDATRRRELDWQLQQAQRLEAIGRLAGGVAHDFNNFLTTIQGLTRLCLDDAALSADTRNDLTEVAKAADRAATVTRRLLAFSRRQVMRPQPLELNAHVIDAQKTVSRLIGEDVVVDAFPEAASSKVFVDPTQLEQILLNLALNARDAMPRGGHLTLRTREVTITPETASAYPYDVRPGDYVLLEVSDTGPGIAPHLRDQVFEPFYTTKSSEFGSGLGLSTVYGIVKQSGGYVWIGDAEGGGAAISIYLPHCEELPIVTVDAPAGAPERRSGTVLLAEDDPTVRFLARRVLSREGYTVLEASDGTEALEICASYHGHIDLLLSDVVMPGLSGSELAARSRPIRPEMAVLFMSGYQEDAMLRAGVQLGTHDLVEKPFSPEELAGRVRNAIAMSAPLSA